MTGPDAHALDESKLPDLIRDLDTGHIQDIDRTATSNAISSLWDMVIELRAQLTEVEKRGRIVGLEEAAARVEKRQYPSFGDAQRIAHEIRALIAQAKGDDA